jgi:uncharacterized membrane protein
MKKIIIYSTIISIVLSACSKTNEITLRGTGGNTNNCDTVNMKYVANVQLILQANCYSCHANGNVNGGVSLGTYTSVKQQADRGNLIGVITHATGYSPMPKGGAKLSDCDINKIKDWVARGALNN